MKNLYPRRTAHSTPRLFVILPIFNPYIHFCENPSHIIGVNLLGTQYAVNFPHTLYGLHAKFFLQSQIRACSHYPKRSDCEADFSQNESKIRVYIVSISSIQSACREFSAKLCEKSAAIRALSVNVNTLLISIIYVAYPPNLRRTLVLTIT